MSQHRVDVSPRGRRRMHYQLGTVLVAGEQKTILACQESLFDLLLFLEHAAKHDTSITMERSLPASLLTLLEHWSYWSEKLPQLVDLLFSDNYKHERSTFLIPEDTFQWLPPVLYPKKLICIGTNYHDHIAEMGISKLPKYPYSFFKPATTTLIGAEVPLQLPEQAKLIDWEAELAVVIGRKAYHVQGQEALACIAGYSILNDISARDWIADAPAVGIDWVMQKAFNGFAPMGPLITPAMFVPNPQNLSITLTVNGQVKQHSNTANMVFSIRQIIEHLTSIMTLEPGDVIATGTPAGVGHGKKPPEYLQSGDTMVITIEELGQLKTRVI